MFFAATTVAVVGSTVAQAAPSPAGAAASPAPAGTPPKEIGRVRSSAYCTMLGRRVAPALVGLMKTDEAISAGHRAFAKMSEDTVIGSANHLDLDRRYLSQVVTIASHNLIVVRKLLSDPTYFPPQAKTSDDREAAELKAKLEAVAKQQNEAVNLLAGAVETDLMGQMQSQQDTNMAGALQNGNASPMPTIDPSQFMSVAGLPADEPNSQFSQKALSSGTTRKQTVYDALAQGLELEQKRITVVEKVASDAVVAAVPLCTSPKAAAPEPTASGIFVPGEPTPRPSMTPIPLIIRKD